MEGWGVNLTGCGRGSLQFWLTRHRAKTQDQERVLGIASPGTVRMAQAARSRPSRTYI